MGKGTEVLRDGEDGGNRFRPGVMRMRKCEAAGDGKIGVIGQWWRVERSWKGGGAGRG